MVHTNLGNLGNSWDSKYTWETWEIQGIAMLNLGFLIKNMKERMYQYAYLGCKNPELQNVLHE